MTTKASYNHSPGLPSIPDDNQLFEVALSLGNTKDIGDTFISEALSLSKELREIHRFPATLHIKKAMANKGMSLNLSLSGVLEDKVKLTPFSREELLRPEKIQDLFRLSQNWAETPRSRRKAFLEYLQKREKRDLLLIQKSGYALVLFEEHKLNQKLSSELLEIFRCFSAFLIVYPPYILSLSLEDQEAFFTLWFESQKNNNLLKDKGSYLWNHIVEYFGDLKIIQEYFSESIELKATVEETRDAAKKGVENPGVGIEVFEKYLPSRGFMEISETQKELQGLYMLGERGINETFSKDIGSIILDIDKLCFLLIGEPYIEIQDKDWEGHITLYRLFLNRAAIRKEDLAKALREYKDNRYGKSTHFSEHIFQTIIFSLLKTNLQDTYGDVEIVNKALIIPLLAVKFLKSYDQADEYFNWWFSQLRGDMKNDIEDPHSQLWQYLLQNFSQIQAVKDKYSEVSYTGLEEGKDIPTDEELDVLYHIYQLSDRNGFTAFLNNTSKIYSSGDNNLSDTERILVRCEQGDLTIERGKIKNAIEEMIARNHITPLYHVLKNNEIGNIEKKKIKRYILKAIESLQNKHERTFLGFLVFSYMVKFKDLDKQLVNFFRKSSIFFLAYPVFLKSRTQEEQNNYFTLYFIILSSDNQLLDINSGLWSYILKYFGDIDIVQSQYSKITSEKREKLSASSTKLDEIWNHKVQRSGRTLAEMKEQFESIDPLDNIVLRIGEEGEVDTNSILDAGGGRNIHVIIYSRSNKGRLSNPQFFVIPKGEGIQGNIIGDFSQGRYSYKIFAHGNSLSFRGQGELPKEVENMTARNLVKPLKSINPDDRGDNKKNGSTTNSQTDARINTEDQPTNKNKKKVAEELFPDEIEVVTEEGISYIDFLFDDPKVDGHQNYIRFSVTESGVLEYQSQTFDPEKKISIRDIGNLQNLGEGEIEDILEQRKKRKEEEERKERKRLEIEELEAAEREDKKSREKARGDVKKVGGFGKIFNEALDFIISSSENERKDDKTGMYFWQLYPGGGIVERIEAMVKNYGFTIALEYDKNSHLSLLIFKSIEHGFIEYKGDTFPVERCNGNMDTYGSEICEQLCLRIIGALFKNQYTKARRNSESVKKITQKAKERKKLLEATNERIRNGTASATELPVLKNKGGDKNTIIWDTVKDLGFVGLKKGDGDITLAEIEERKLGIQGRSGVLRAGGAETKISQAKADGNYESVIEHIKNDESEFMIDYLFRRIFYTLKVNNKKLRKPRIIQSEDSYTAFQDNAEKAILGLKLEVDNEVKYDKMKQICIKVIEAFKEQKVPLLVVKPAVFTPRELIFAGDE